MPTYKRRNDPVGSQPAAVTLATAAENKLEDFAEDLGRLLGTAQVKAESWIGQRRAIAEQLTQIRDAAEQWISALTGNAGDGAEHRRAPARPVGSRTVRGTEIRRRGPGRPPKSAAPLTASAAQSAQPRKRTISAEGRARIAAAQRARWAKQKRASAR